MVHVPASVVFGIIDVAPASQAVDADLEVAAFGVMITSGMECFNSQSGNGRNV